MDKQPNSRTCFLCGRQNDMGLKMSWYNDPDRRQITGTVTVPDHFNGYPGIVHGGIVAALIDETAGRSLLLGGDTERLMVTLKLEVRYRLPTPTGQPLTVVGRLLKQTASRARVTAEVQLADGTVTADGEALVVLPPQEFFDRWEPEKQYWRVYDD
jgi:acyl-coenzyme A thioesterase PaaI-like protein